MQDQTKTGGQAGRGGASHPAVESAPTAFVSLDEIAPSPKLDLERIRQRLEGTRGREFWRSLEEVADTPEFRRYIEREFPHAAPRDMQPLSRRNFLQLMGATLALAGISGCAYQPPEKIVPYIEQPESVVPGKPNYYATAFDRGGYAIGILGETHVGRPTKLEGNPAHPASLGATDIFTQASLLMLYDPERSRSARYLGSDQTWEQFQAAILEPIRAARARRGAGVWLLMSPSTSPTLGAQLQRFRQRFPGARVLVHDAVSRENVYAGTRMAFGQELQPVYDFAQAQRILSLDADFLTNEVANVRYAHDFMRGRRVRDGQTEMNRLYMVEGTMSLTGANADHRLGVAPSQVEAVARAIAAALGVGGANPGVLPDGVAQEWITAVANDLREHGGRSLVLAGPEQSAAVHALAHAINGAVGAVGRTVTYVEPVELRFGDSNNSLRQLTDAISANQVDALIIVGANPAYTAPADVPFAEALKSLSSGAGKVTVHMGLYEDETAALCQWHLPQSHYLEAWSDARAFDGTASIVQPLIQPLYATHSVHELVATLLEDDILTGLEIVRDYWRRRSPGTNFDDLWYQALTRGIVPNTKAPARTVSAGALALPASEAQPPTAQAAEIAFRPDPTIWDGQWANSGWLQELPKHISTLTWDNAVMMSPEMAQQLGLTKEDMVDLRLGDRTLQAAVWTVPGHPKNSVTLTLGYGRERAGRLGNGFGFNAYRLRGTDALWNASGLQIVKTGRRYPLAGTQHHFTLAAERGLIKYGTLSQLLEDPKHPPFLHQEHHGAPEDAAQDTGNDPHVGTERPGPGPEHPDVPNTLYPQMWPSDRQNPQDAGPGTYTAQGYNSQPIPAWGMVIDLNACIGCHACTIACQAENNIATVGKDQVLMNREMHWIRIDQYHTGTVEDPERVFEPVPCMHCEKAPCEPVCPVEATSHSAEGINEMTYNRCIGTRYCSNNCPYKVRRFNFLQFSDQHTPSIQLMRNPDVTTRSRGVMEKCTYCIQRINLARIEAEKEERRIEDGDVITACAQVCPTEAIIFGNINDDYSNQGRGSRVRQLKAGPFNYGLLTELNTMPRTTYLAKLRNPNPVIEPAAAHGAGGHGAAGHDAGGHGTESQGAAGAHGAAGNEEGH